VIVRDPDPHDITFANPEDALYATFAGDLVAHADGRDFKTLIVRNWRTGAELSRTKLRSAIEEIAVRADGRVALIANDQLFEIRGSKPKRLGKDARGPLAYAGNRILFSDQYDHPRVSEPSGRIRRWGPPTETFVGLDADGRHVLWEANGCLLVDDVTVPPSQAPGKGPCQRNELELDKSGPNPPLARTLTITLRCVASPNRCRGSLRLKAFDTFGEHSHLISRRQRFTIRPGTAKRIAVGLTTRGYRILRRYVKADESASVGVITEGTRLPDNRGSGVLVVPKR
jgi:hypothetical protein